MSEIVTHGLSLFRMDLTEMSVNVRRCLRDVNGLILVKRSSEGLVLRGCLPWGEGGLLYSAHSVGLGGDQDPLFAYCLRREGQCLARALAGPWEFEDSWALRGCCENVFNDRFERLEAVAHRSLTAHTYLFDYDGWFLVFGGRLDEAGCEVSVGTVRVVVHC